MFIAYLPKLTAAPAAPEISEVRPFAWTLHSTNRITLVGKNLSEVQAVWSSRYGTVAVDRLADVDSNSEEVFSWNIKLENYELPGPFALRLITGNGISAPVMATYGDYIEALTIGPSGLVGKTGVLRSLKRHKYNSNLDRERPGESGTVTDVVEKPEGVQYLVRGIANHQFGIEVTAGRIGSKLDPVIRVLSVDGHELSYTNDTPGLGVDCRLFYVAPETTDYLVEIRDAQYGSGDNYRFQAYFGALRSDDKERAVIVYNFSSALAQRMRRGNTNGFRGRIAADVQLQPGSELSNKPLGAMPLIDLHDVAELRAGPFVFVASYPVGEPAKLSGIHNQYQTFVADGLSVNIYLPYTGTSPLQIEMKEPGRRRLTAISRRIGGSSDPLMVLRNPAGEKLQDAHLFKNEAVISHDFKEPGVYLLDIWDASALPGQGSVCHLAIERNPADFELNTETDSLRIPAGGEGELSVTIDRDGYDGTVKFELAHGPEGVELTDVVAKEKSKEAKFKVKLTGSLAQGTTFPLKISGRRGEAADAPKTPLYTSAYWGKRFPDLHSPMFEFEDTVWVTVLPPP